MRSSARKREAPDIRRRAIIDVAIIAIGERGYLGFTIQDLAQRCGLTNGGLLYHFGSKEALLLAVLDECEERDKIAIRDHAGTKAEEARTAPLSWADAQALVHATMVRSTQQPEIVRLQCILRAEALDPGHPAHDYILARERRQIATFSRLLRPFVDHPISASRILVALADGLEQQWLRVGESFDLIAEWDRAMALLLCTRFGIENGRKTTP